MLTITYCYFLNIDCNVKEMFQKEVKPNKSENIIIF